MAWLFAAGSFSMTQRKVWLPSRDGLAEACGQAIQTGAAGFGSRPGRWVLNWCVDQEGSLWLGLEANGLAARSADPVQNPDHGTTGFPIDSTRSVFQDREGHICIGTLAGIAEWTDGRSGVMPMSMVTAFRRSRRLLKTARAPSGLVRRASS